MKSGDELHLTVMGGDEYFQVQHVYVDGDYVYWKAVGVAALEHIVNADTQVRVKSPR